jgi:prevent-host-death family protein
MEWQTAEAKNKFSELLDRAEAEGPQRVSRRNKRFVVIEE